MSKNKKKKRRSKSASSAYVRSEGSTLADEMEQERSSHRMNPVARNILLGDMVFLGICVLLDEKGIVTPVASLILTVIALGLIVVAMFIQFGGGGKKGGRTL